MHSPAVGINEGRQGARRQHTKEFDIRRFVAALLDEDAAINLQEAIDEGVDYVLRQLGVSRKSVKNIAPLLAFIDYGVSNQHLLLTRQRGHVKVIMEDTAVSKEVERIKKNILSNIFLPSGKLILDSTREEIVAFRSDLRKLIGKLQPGQTPRQAGITSL